MPVSRSQVFFLEECIFLSIGAPVISDVSDLFWTHDRSQSERESYFGRTFPTTGNSRNSRSKLKALNHF